ncbi:VIT family protein [Candidatus Methylomirabilis lanthanidiphila]|uniref:VIT family protein n=1 Tax=Candidatus Methylomirabilis lanthanidiphila TaxID=2211376 RepID=A0A564ZNA0_9BACT|nr:VIT1/CCC1 transporter family protein [Candidatus Methylomirabilis lanthanidiphila]VUZ86122.1 VIT family protein [Candidatus Methylomirabilis lanthanidiphila]
MNATRIGFGKIEESSHFPVGRRIREVVFGIHDGLITTVAFLAGVNAASAGQRMIVISSVAEALAQTLSMGFGAYLSTKSEGELYQREIARERLEIETMPEKEREEMCQIYRSKGFSEDEVELVVTRLTADKERLLKAMMVEELGLIEERFDNPVKVGVLMGVSSCVGAIIPIAPYLFLELREAFVVSMSLAAFALFATGAGKTVLTRKAWWRSGLEMLGIGLLVSVAGYGIGYFLSALWY